MVFGAMTGSMLIYAVKRARAIMLEPASSGCTVAVRTMLTHEGFLRYERHSAAAALVLED